MQQQKKKKYLKKVAIEEIKKFFEDNKDRFQSQLVNNTKKKTEKPSLAKK
jgi:hypothetical protein